ncbi:hypothetical protein BDZ90DRAFT_244285 [Jaminaea rosea]|uniref:NAD-dependent epimerase/dehydratase domain-containing protein n=1 Tax=Jaminaea rosea TaxID=1569628 RepID=A0A316ULJ2_9BASI|nr:hypothetical protein BDZ90DRAFT_244285 [Jaminaea rosea]PWN24793.1 hypothetical protein BDZ90DRAFT_244285 [Jaminaea rosea]
MAAAAQASTSKHALVVGGAGFLGSAITKRLVSQGHTVTSISRSGRPFLTPSGHRPAWSTSPRLKWRAADAHSPQSYRSILAGEETGVPPVSAIVSTMGILLEGNYKGSSSSLEGTAKALMKGWGVGGSNPLQEEGQGGGGPTYEQMNRDAALSVASTWREVLSSATSSQPLPPFVFISAEDIFRPIVDERYILTKRQAEQGLRELSWVTQQEAASSPSSSPGTADADGAGLDDELRQSRRQVFRSIAIRPGLMYHPHTRPLSTLPAALLDLSCAVHSSRLASLLPATPASVLAGVLGQQPLARLLTLSPLHIDTVAKAVSEAIMRDGLEGVVDTQGIKALAGWKQSEAEVQSGRSAWAESRM